MSDRQFAAAHDRWLEPPDDEPEDEEQDEMDLADQRRQRQLDEEDFQARKKEWNREE